MTKQKRNAVRRDKTIGEYRAELSKISNPESKSQSYLDDELDGLDRIIKQKSSALEQKVAASIKIQKMKQAGLAHEDIEQAKKDFGLSSTPTQQDSQESATNLIATELAGEQDPDRRDRLLQTLAGVEALGKAGGSQNQIALLMSNMNRGPIQKKDTFESKMMEKLADHLFKEPKSELDNLDKLTSLVEKVQKLTPQTDSLEEMKKNIEVYKTLGIISDRKDTIEETRLEIEKMKAEKEFEIRKEEILADKARTESLGIIASDGIASAFSAIGAAGGKGGQKKEIPQEKYIKNSLEGTCSKQGCGAKILVTNTDTSRNVKCTKCGQLYQFDANQKRLFEAPQEGSSSSTQPPGPQSREYGPSMGSDHPIA